MNEATVVADLLHGRNLKHPRAYNNALSSSGFNVFK